MDLSRWLTAVVLYSVALAAQGQPADGTPLSTGELTALLENGGLIQGQNSRGQIYELRLAVDGSMQATSTRSNGPGKITDSGKWQVRDGGLCITYTEWQSGATRCASVKRQGDDIKYGSDSAALIPTKAAKAMKDG